MTFSASEYRDTENSATSMHSSKIYLNKQALERNISFLKKIIKKGVNISSVIKGNAYGHGIKHFVPMAMEAGINHFSVFSAEEAQQALNAAISPVTVMIMGQLEHDDLKWAMENRVEFFVFDFHRLEHTIKVAQECNLKARIHIEVETGMNRTGFSMQDLPEVLHLLKTNGEALEMKGLCTHFAGAESIVNEERVLKQQQVFKKALELCEEMGCMPDYVHAACSAATVRYPDMQFNMVRIGIMQYGFWPTKEVYVEYLRERSQPEYNPLQRVISWKTYVMSIKKVKEGEYIGYGDSFLAQRDMKLAIIPIGYGYGYSRSLSNQGKMLIGGKFVPVIGTVNMNCATVDITEVENVQIGDEVVLIGQQGEQELTIASFAELSEQVNYEMLTRLPRNIPRIIQE
ncbi:alanine racemase [Limibacter armeniacum]|uniref:alanine racemase n=1 Tax=Limibacter armeniacum TaxID=466084 RepID=UPI002FE50D79